jgi:hypothetical protein
MRALVSVVSTILVVGLVSGADAAVYSDSFDSNHVYWDGSSVDVSGTIWDGVQGTNFLDASGDSRGLDANQENTGHLTFDHSSTAHDGSASPFDSAAIYRNVTGDFDVKVEMPVLPPDPGGDTAFLTLSLAAWTADGTQAVHIDNIQSTAQRLRFRDLANPDEYGIATANKSWFRMVRTGDQFEGFYGTNGVDWTHIGTMVRAYGDTLRVGLSVWNFEAEAFHGEFDNFTLNDAPTPPVPDGSGQVLRDTFDTTHTYWDGASVDVSGTIWDGVQQTNLLTEADASSSSPGNLQLSYEGTASSPTEGATSGNFDVAALYMNVSGDFDAHVQFPHLPPTNVSFRTLALAAWKPDMTQAVHLDLIMGTDKETRFRDLVPGGPGSDNYSLNLSSYPRWFRLKRVGDVFTAYYDTNHIFSAWTEIGSIDTSAEPSGVYGDDLRVGLATWNLNSGDFYARFDNFLIAFPPRGTVVSVK